MEKKENKKILIFDPVEFQVKGPKVQQTMGLPRVPIEGIKADMEDLLSNFKEIFEGVGKLLGNTRLEHVDLSLGLALDGSVGIFGTKAGAEAKGGINVRLVFK